MDATLERDFSLVYFSNGGISYQDIQAMNLYEVNFFFKRLYEEKKKEKQRYDEMNRKNSS